MRIEGLTVSLTSSEADFVHRQAGVYRHSLDLASRLYDARLAFVRPFLPPHWQNEDPPRFDALYNNATPLDDETNEQGRLVVFLMDISALEKAHSKDARGVEQPIITLSMSQEELALVRRRAAVAYTAARGLLAEELADNPERDVILASVSPERVEDSRESDEAFYLENLSQAMVTAGIIRAIDEACGTPPPPSQA